MKDEFVNQHDEGEEEGQRRFNRPGRGPQPGRKPTETAVERLLRYEDVLQQFIACPRCGHFFTGYRVLHGVQLIEEAAKKHEEGWLALVWDAPTRQLLHKSYGVRLEPDLYFFEFCCLECQRKFTYQLLEGEESVTHQLRVDLRLR